jgi:hypothetical protein
MTNSQPPPEPEPGSRDHRLTTSFIAPDGQRWSREEPVWSSDVDKILTIDETVTWEDEEWAKLDAVLAAVTAQMGSDVAGQIDTIALSVAAAREQQIVSRGIIALTAFQRPPAGILTLPEPQRDRPPVGSWAQRPAGAEGRRSPGRPVRMPAEGTHRPHCGTPLTVTFQSRGRRILAALVISFIAGAVCAFTLRSITRE